jgi:putative tricarboxylic transport membrane protein
MSNRVLGILCCVVSIVLWFYAIPEWVSSPSNVTKVVLSPTFWPLIITGLIALCGTYLLVTGEVAGDEQIEALEQPQNKGAGATRLLLTALAMLAFLVAVETSGLIIGSMALFITVAAVITQKISTRMVLIAIILPIALYGFFAHVASVAIPQGEWVQLP